MSNFYAPARPRVFNLCLLVLLASSFLAGCASIPAQASTRLASQAYLPQVNQAPLATPAPVSEEVSNEEFLLVEEFVIAMLLVAVLVGIIAQRLRVPYTVGLVLIGLALALGVHLELNFPPNLILALLVPPLIFEAAFHLNLSNLRRDLIAILALAVPGVILTTLIVGGVVSWGTGLSFPVALVFGALVSATDPVSVVALFRKMGVPQRLQVLLEGESLFNDGTAIVVTNLVLGLALSATPRFDLAASLVDFVRIAGGGVLIGLVLGALVSQMISRIDDYLIETTLTSLLAYGAYLLAEMVGVSGVLAVVAAGLVNGNIGPRGMSPTTRIVVYNFWEYAAFLANSFIFLLIGLKIRLPLLFENWRSIVWAIGAVLLARLVSVYGVTLFKREIPSAWRHVLYWGGLRGAIALALALSLPEALGASAGQVQVMAFGVVLYSLLFHGFTMAPLVRRLGVIERSEAQDEYERRHARAVASRLAYEHLHRHNRQGLLSDHTWGLLAPALEGHNQALIESVRAMLSKTPSLEAEELSSARKEYLRAQRSAINSLLRDGVISEDIFTQLVTEIDAALVNPLADWTDLFGQLGFANQRIDRLMTAVVQEQDVENAISSLTKLGLPVTCLPSVGGFLNRRNRTLLIGLAAGQEEVAVLALSKSCRQRIHYLPHPPGVRDLPLSEPIPVTVGGAVIFTYLVERFESF